jgi:hypothetical protein
MRNTRKSFRRRGGAPPIGRMRQTKLLGLKEGAGWGEVDAERERLGLKDGFTSAEVDAAKKKADSSTPFQLPIVTRPPCHWPRQYL